MAFLENWATALRTEYGILWHGIDLMWFGAFRKRTADFVKIHVCLDMMKGVLKFG